MKLFRGVGSREAAGLLWLRMGGGWSLVMVPLPASLSFWFFSWGFPVSVQVYSPPHPQCPPPDPHPDFSPPLPGLESKASAK